MRLPLERPDSSGCTLAINKILVPVQSVKILVPTILLIVLSGHSTIQYLSDKQSHCQRRKMQNISSFPRMLSSVDYHCTICLFEEPDLFSCLLFLNCPRLKQSECKHNGIPGRAIGSSPELVFSSTTIN